MSDGELEDTAATVEGRCKWDMPFDHLPDEIMVKIFSLFSFNDLIDIVQNVCVRWRRLSHDPALWLNKEYLITGKNFDLMWRSCCGAYFTECVHCRYAKTKEEVLQAVGMMPQLRTLTLMRGVPGDVLRKICMNCPNLRTLTLMRCVPGDVLRKICTNCPNLMNLEIDDQQKMDYSLLKYIFEKCPKIKKLIMGTRPLADRRCAEVFSSLEHLNSLELSHCDSSDVGPVQLCVLADACLRLEEIKFFWWDYTLTDDLEYFFRTKKHSLTSATLPWMIESRRCVVTLLKKCDTSLRKLRLINYCKYDYNDVPTRYMRPEMEPAAFEALGELHSLNELDFTAWPYQPQLISLAFRPGCLTQLRLLHLSCDNLQNATVLSISRNCPNLCELKLRAARDITDVALSEIYRLKHLEILHLSCCNGLGGAAVAHIAQLPALHTLRLRYFKDLTMLQPSVCHIVDMKELQCLDITRSNNIEAVPFDEFPGRLVKLRELWVKYDREDNVFAELQRKMPHLKINSFEDHVLVLNIGDEID